MKEERCVIVWCSLTLSVNFITFQSIEKKKAFSTEFFFFSIEWKNTVEFEFRMVPFCWMSCFDVHITWVCVVPSSNSDQKRWFSVWKAARKSIKPQRHCNSAFSCLRIILWLRQSINKANDDRRNQTHRMHVDWYQHQRSEKWMSATTNLIALLNMCLKL